MEVEKIELRIVLKRDKKATPSDKKEQLNLIIT